MVTRVLPDGVPRRRRGCDPDVRLDRLRRRPCRRRRRDENDEGAGRRFHSAAVVGKEKEKKRGWGRPSTSYGNWWRASAAAACGCCCWRYARGDGVDAEIDVECRLLSWCHAARRPNCSDYIVFLRLTSSSLSPSPSLRLLFSTPAAAAGRSFRLTVACHLSTRQTRAVNYLNSASSHFAALLAISYIINSVQVI